MNVAVSLKGLPPLLLSSLFFFFSSLLFPLALLLEVLMLVGGTFFPLNLFSLLEAEML